MDILTLSPAYTDAMIYSKDVPVIRDSKGNLLGKPILCNFITCPAVNRTFAHFMMSDKKIIQIMERRINKIISFAHSKDPDVAILGAFGWGILETKKKQYLNCLKMPLTTILMISQT